MTYDGFISYSHAADDLLAPRLQAGLQRFAKPWWQRRALRIFRDEVSLSANPHLWASITGALDESEWLVLLLSPDAAESEWVNREIEYWTDNRDVSRILPVVTEGSFAWRDGEISGSAVPPALRGAFPGEPRWVDMRFAHSDEHLDLKNPEFLDSVADIASTLRGVPKDELASEEVRQHRRTTRTAGSAGVALLALFAVSVVFGIQASQQRQIAEATAEEAAAQRDLALDNERRALESEAEALRQAAIVESQRLTTRSAIALETDAETAALLALYAISIAPDAERRAEGESALRAALGEHRLLKRIRVPEGDHLAELSLNGDIIYHWSGPAGVVRAIDIDTDDVEWELPLDGRARSVSVSPDGSLLAVSLDATDGLSARTDLIDTSTQGVRTLFYEECDVVHPHEGRFSLSGDFFTISVRQCAGDGPAADWALLYNTSTWDVEYVYESEGYLIEKLRMSEDDTRIARYHWFGEALSEGLFGTVQVLTYPDLELMVTTDRIWYFGLSPDGERLLHDHRAPAFLELVDVVSGTVVGQAVIPEAQASPICCDPLRFSPDGQFVSAVSDRRDFVLKADGSLEVVLYETGETLDHSWSARGARLLTSHPDQLLVWWIRPDPNRSTALARTDDLIGLAFEFLTRGFTSADCHTHNLDCPSLDDLRIELLDSG